MAAEAPAARAYGLVKTPAAQAALAGLPAGRRAQLEDALAGLCAGPQPPESRRSALRLRGHKLYELPVQADPPSYLVMYAVNEPALRVTVVAVERLFV